MPNSIAAQAELERLRQQLQGDHQQAHVPPVQVPLQEAGPPRAQPEMPNTRMMPLNEFNRSQPLRSLAFPTLFPRGQADFMDPRIRPTKYNEYIKLCLQWHDGRFARHPRFRFIAFNTLMRQHVNQRLLWLQVCGFQPVQLMHWSKWCLRPGKHPRFPGSSVSHRSAERDRSAQLAWRLFFAYFFRLYVAGPGVAHA